MTATAAPAKKSAATRKPGRRAPKEPAARPLLVPGPPIVNLIPPAYIAAAQKRTRRKQAVVTAAGAVGALVLVYLAQTAQIAAANHHLSAEKATGTSLAAQAADPKLTGTIAYYAGVDAMAATAGKAMADEVLYSKLLVSLQAAIPAGSSLSSVSLTVTGGSSTSTATTPAANDTAAASCPGTSPFEATVVVGCVTFTGTAPDRNAVGRLLTNLTKDTKTFANPFIPTATAAPDTAGVGFSGTVGLTANVFSGRYGAGYLDAGGK